MNKGCTNVELSVRCRTVEQPPKELPPAASGSDASHSKKDPDLIKLSNVQDVRTGHTFLWPIYNVIRPYLMS